MERRRFVAAGLASLAAAKLARASTEGPPALLGGTPVRKEPFPQWPVSAAEEQEGLASVLRSGRWGRGGGSVVTRFETAYARLMGAKACLATANGTSALLTALNALGVGPGDEVVVPPYTFVATVNVVLQQHALPVFADSDRDTFQMDAGRLEAAVTPSTAAILPVHLGGGVCDMDTLLAVAGRHNIPILEDACQAHLAEWKGRKAGTLGRLGCFSFQASKNLNCGEGGAIVSNDSALIEACYAFHNNSRGRQAAGADFHYAQRGLNLRLTEFQASLLIAQMKRLELQSKIREENAAYLTGQLAQIPGIRPARIYAGVTRNAYHLYMFRYEAEAFAGLPRARFIKAMAAEGVPVSGGYAPLNAEPFLKNTLASKGYQRIYGEKTIREWPERNRCPANDRLCREAVWLTQTMLLGPRRDMDDIAAAVKKIHARAPDLARS